MEEGYITIATNNNSKYVEMALNLALSIKNKDKRPICLLTDNITEIPQGYKRYFNYIITIAPGDEIVGTLNKFLLFKYSPFQRTMYIDADSLMVKNDISFFWNALSGYNFTVVGGECRKGPWYGKEMKEIIAKIGIPYMVAFTGAFIYFDKAEITAKVFEKAYEYYKNHKDTVSVPVDCGRLGRKEQYSDEPFFGVAMGFYNLKPIPDVFQFKPQIRQPILSSDKFSRFKYKIYKVDCLKGSCVLVGEDWHRRSPTILHFYGEPEPSYIYIREANRLRRHYGLPMIDIRQVQGNYGKPNSLFEVLKSRFRAVINSFLAMFIPRDI